MVAERRTTVTLGLLIGSVIAIAAIACGGGEATVVPVATRAQPTVAAAQPTATTAPATPAASGKVTVALGDIPPLIQEPRRDIAATGGIGKDFSIYETIVRAPHVAAPKSPPLDYTLYSPKDMGIAESWEVSSDFTSITFKIRPNIPWHKNAGDWGVVTAEDVAWTFNSAFAADSVNNGAEEIGVDMKLGFEVVDPLTVRQKIKPGGFDPLWAWLEGNASFNGIVIVSKKAFESLGVEKFGVTPIGTGKYRALQWLPADEIVLEAVQKHWTGITPSVKSVTIVSMPEQATRDAALRAGEIDIGELSAQVIKATVNAIGGRIQEIGIARPQGIMPAGNYWSTSCADCQGGQMPRPGFEQAIANASKYPWVGNPADPASMERARKVRWAMAMVIDQDSLIKNILDGLGRKIYAWQNILPDDPLHKDKWKIPYDPVKARQYMAEAGYANGFDVELWNHAGPPTGPVADAVAEMWRKELKINVTIDKTAYATRRPQTVDHTINVPFVHGINWIADGGPTSARYICPAAGHIVGLTMEKGICDVGLSNATERDLKKRVANNIQVQDYLSEQMLFIPMFQTPALLFAVGPKIAAWDPYNSQDVLPNRPESIRLK